MPRIMGLDPGAKRIGVSVSNSEFTMAFPRESLDALGDWPSKLATLVLEENVGRIIIGLPHNLAGQRTAATDAADVFTSKVQEICPEVEIGRWDERLTTVEASRSLRDAGKRSNQQKSLIDSAAATILLQSYLEAL